MTQGMIKKLMVMMALIAALSLALVSVPAWAASEFPLGGGTISTAIDSQDADKAPADSAFVKSRAKQNVNAARGSLISDGTYYIILSTNASTVMGSKGVIENKSGTKSQKWKLSFDYDTQNYTITNAKTGKVLTAPKKAGKAVTESTLVKKSTRLSSYATRTVPIPTQRWLLRSNKHVYFFVSAANKDLALDFGYSKAKLVKGTKKFKCKYAWLMGAAGTFKTNGISNGSYTIKLKGAGNYLNISKSSIKKNAKAVVGKGLTLYGRVFDLVSVGNNGYYKLLNYNTGMALTASGSNVVQKQYSNKTKAAQLWKPEIVGSDGSVTFTNLKTKKVLTAKGSRVVLAPYDSVNANQRWLINPTTTGLTFIGKKALYRANSYSSKTGYTAVIDMDYHEFFLFKKAREELAGGPFTLDSTSRCATGAGRCTSACVTTMGWRAVYKEGIGAKWCIDIHRGSNLHSYLFGAGSSDAQMGWNISHGCVRLPMWMAEHVYKVTSDGTRIIRYYA